MSNPINPLSNIALPDDFVFGEVKPNAGVRPQITADLALGAIEKLGPVLTPQVTPAPPTLGPLAGFVGNWTGNGFNTIFRPDNSVTPTAPNLPHGLPASDNILELNLTSEKLSFTSALGSVPNRGTTPQGDMFLNGISYIQAINDITTSNPGPGIHVEPGLWMITQPTTDPSLGVTVVRMASIPHGVTIQAQGTASPSTPGAPTIPAVSITPFFTSGGAPNRFTSQTLTNNQDRRIPQDLTSFNAAGTITQAILDDPNTVLRNALAGLNVQSFIRIDIATNPAPPIFGGGVDNIAFLLRDNNPIATNSPNARTVTMSATFWIETIEHVLHIPIFKVGQPPLMIPGTAAPGHTPPIFSVHPPIDIPTPRNITVTSTQIQYTQTVMLNFAPLTWPHVSVATLTPATALPVPASAWA